MFRFEALPLGRSPVENPLQIFLQVHLPEGVGVQGLMVELYQANDRP